MSGAYMLLNNQTGECYIGVSRDMRWRKWRHFNDLKNGTHTNPGIVEAWMDNALVFVILCYQEMNLRELEKRLTSVIKPEYDAWPEGRERSGLTRRGSSLSDEHRAKISAANRNRKGMKFSYPVPRADWDE